MWANFCQHVDKEAASLLENELIAEDTQDPIVIDNEDASDDEGTGVRIQDLVIDDLELEYPDMF